MKKRGARPKITEIIAQKIRDEYRDNPKATYEYLADKFELHPNTVSRVINNLEHHDPNYSKSVNKVGGTKKSVFIPAHIQELKDLLTPAPTTAHRARGQNNTIARFK